MLIDICAHMYLPSTDYEKGGVLRMREKHVSSDLRVTCTTHDQNTLFQSSAKVGREVDSQGQSHSVHTLQSRLLYAAVAMVSGHGARGGRGRCYTLWKDFMGCVEQIGRTSLDVCQAQREDYMECLHNTKLVGVLISAHQNIW